MNLKGFYSLVVILLYNIFVKGNNILIKDDCKLYGFNSNILECSTCQYILKTLNHEATYDKCSKCCIEKVEEKYNYAILEVDKRYLPFMKELSLVVESKNELKLKVKYKYGSPTLYMYKDKLDSEASEVISVGNWKKDTFVEYLSTHLNKVK